jgi:hypothetical protein
MTLLARRVAELESILETWLEDQEQGIAAVINARG